MVLEPAAFGEDGAEDSADAGGVERAGVVLQQIVEDGGFAGFVGYGEAALLLEARDFGDGLGAAVDEAEKLEIELVDGGALLSKCLGHGEFLLEMTGKKTKAAIWDRGRCKNCVRSLES
jgi:hypothetical protein